MFVSFAGVTTVRLIPIPPQEIQAQGREVGSAGAVGRPGTNIMELEAVKFSQEDAKNFLTESRSMRVCLFVCPFVCLYVCLAVCLLTVFLTLPVCLSFCLPLCG